MKLSLLDAPTTDCQAPSIDAAKSVRADALKRCLAVVSAANALLDFLEGVRIENMTDASEVQRLVRVVSSVRGDSYAFNESLGTRVLQALESTWSELAVGDALPEEEVLDTGDGIPGQVFPDAEYLTSMVDG